MANTGTAWDYPIENREIAIFNKGEGAMIRLALNDDAKQIVLEKLASDRTAE